MSQQFQPNSPQVYQQNPVHAPGGTEPGLLGNGGIGEFLMNLGVGAFTGNWAPLIGGAIGGGGAGGAAASAMGGKKPKSDNPSWVGDEEPGDAEKRLDPVELTSSKMTPELGQPMQLTAPPQPYRDPMKWWSPPNA